jgi:hypothetical protein
MGWDEQQAWGEERQLRSSDANWCLRLFRTRGSCLQYSYSTASREAGKRCICENPAVAELKDHYRVWSNATLGRVLTTEPYNATSERIEALREVTTSLGLALHVVKQGVWTDGVPMLVIAQPEITREMLNL